MGKRPDFMPVKTTDGWMVSVPGAMSATGRRVRRFFGEDKGKAEKFGARMRGLHTAGHRGGLLPAEVALQAAAAWKVLEPLGISLVEAARMVAALEGASGKTEVFYDRWVRCVNQGEMVWSSRYAEQMGRIPKWLGKDVMRRPCGELTEEVITGALRANGAAASTVLMRRARVMAVMKWKEERVRGAKKGDIQILTPGQCARVLRACETKEQRWAVALLLFAGIRPDAEAGEIARLRWEAVGAKEIYVDPKTSKVGDRHVEIQPRLRRLLRGHPVEGDVRPLNWKRAWQRIRKEAGIAEMNDVLRHTFASNHLAAFGEEATKQAMGHTKGSDTLFRHYRRAVTREAGRKFFSVREERGKNPEPRGEEEKRRADCLLR